MFIIVLSVFKVFAKIRFFYEKEKMFFRSVIEMKPKSEKDSYNKKLRSLDTELFY